MHPLAQRLTAFTRAQPDDERTKPSVYRVTVDNDDDTFTLGNLLRDGRMKFLIDHAAREIALRHWVLPDCLHVPIAAVDETAIANYIGDIEQVLAGETRPTALVIRVKQPPPIDPRLPIWKLPASKVLHQHRQVWVHFAYTRYRKAYTKAFPDEVIADKVLSHVMNRRIVTLKGFQYVRIVPTSRGCNSSSGFSENWGVALHSTPDQIAANRKRGAFIQYADLSDLMLMLDMKVGGGIMAVVNEGQKLVCPRTIEG